MSSGQLRILGAGSRPFSGLLAAASLGAGLVLAFAHPLAPTFAFAVFMAIVFLTYYKPASWLFLLPALLPFANFLPWTGWLIFEEFDLLLLAVLTGAYAARALRPGVAEQSLPLSLRLALGLFGLSVAIAFLRGVADAGTWHFGWFQDYFDPLNSVRVSKSVLFALLLLPLMQAEVQRNQNAAIRHLACGMVFGLFGVALAVCWERALFPGLFDFSQPYRTTALFWEMHVGGAALDGYLVLAAPFALWAVLSSRRFLPWLAAAAVTLLFGYACLTTFARGVYLGVAVALFVFVFFRLRSRYAGLGKVLGTITMYCLGGLLVAGIFAWFYWYGGFVTSLVVFVGLFLLALVLARIRPELPWIRLGGTLLAVALTIEVVAVLYGGSFMFDRLVASNRDFGQRLQHWQNGVGLLSTAPEWLFGKGLGRLPANYARTYRSGESPGRAELTQDEAGNGYVRLSGPQSRLRLSGLFALSQRLTIDPRFPVQVEMDVRLKQNADLGLQLCEKHLLYPVSCLNAFMRVTAKGGAWQHLRLEMTDGDALGVTWLAMRPQHFSLSLLTPGKIVEVDNIAVINHGENALHNGNFASGLQGWFPTAQYYFLPWHIDNLYLELLVERGLFGLLALAGLVFFGVKQWLGHTAHPFTPYLLAALCAYGTLGMVSSLMDVPRVALLFHLLLFFSLALRTGEYDKRQVSMIVK